MEQKNLEQLKSILDIKEGSGIEMAFDAIFDQIPLIGKILTTIKLRKLKRRMNEHSEKLTFLESKISTIEDNKFTDLIKNFLFPIILQELIEEDEDNKIAYFLNGFEQVIDSKITDKSKILVYYDVLRELRFIDIEYLIKLTWVYEHHLINNSISNDNLVDLDATEERYGSKLYSYFKSDDFGNINVFVESKLEKLGLIDLGKSITYEEIFERMALQEKYSISNFNDGIKVTSFGHNFLDFYGLLNEYHEE